MTPSRGAAPLAPALPETLRGALERARATFRKMPLADRPDPAVPERLRVRDSMDRFQAALDAACDAMSTDAVRDALRSPVAYWRFLAGKSLARRGAAGLRIATAGLNDEDWRVRSACCDALTFIRKAAARAEDEEEDFAPAAGDKAAASDSARAARLTALLADENAWVRCRAATALGAMGKADSAVVTALVKAVVDPDAWVRSAALGSIDKVTDDPQAVLRAAGEALRVPSTSFAQMGRSMALIEKRGADNKALIPSLVFALEHPGEGEGSQRLSQIMAMLVDLDPDGAIAVPVMAKVAAGGYAYDRLRGAPRQAAIERLGKMGPKAAAAVPVLKSIAAGTDEKQKELRAAAQAALDRIVR